MTGLDKCYRNLNNTILKLITQSAQKRYQRQTELVKAEIGKPARAGYLYSRKLSAKRQRSYGVQEYEIYRHMLVLLGDEDEDGDKLFIAPVYDHHHFWGSDAILAEFALPGYGELTVNLSQSKWVSRKIVSSWILCAVLEHWRLISVYRGLVGEIV